MLYLKDIAVLRVLTCMIKTSKLQYAIFKRYSCTQGFRTAASKRTCKKQGALKGGSPLGDFCDDRLKNSQRHMRMKKTESLMRSLLRSSDARRKAETGSTFRRTLDNLIYDSISLLRVFRREFFQTIVTKSSRGDPCI